MLLRIIILLGVFIIPLINSRITDILGFSFGLLIDNLQTIPLLQHIIFLEDLHIFFTKTIPSYTEAFIVNGNFEFTKVMFFNIWMSVVFVLYLVQSLLSQKKGIAGINAKTLVYMAIILALLGLSTVLSLSPYESFFGDESKGHGMIFFINILGFFLILLEMRDKEFLKKILVTFIISGVIASLIGLKEYYIPTFNYGELSTRLFATFGHPNYISIFYVSLLPAIYFFVLNTSIIWKKVLYIFTACLFIFCLVLTKSILALFLCGIYIIYEVSVYFSLRKKIGKLCFFSIIGFILFAGAITVFAFLPEKLHSFVSRFFIWQAAFDVITSHVKVFFIGTGAETFILNFDSVKSEYLYIFENLGFNADRPHNVFLNAWLHFGLGILLLLCILFRKIVIDVFESKKSKTFTLSLLLMGVFWCFNYPSIANYLVFITIFLHCYYDEFINVQDNSQKTVVSSYSVFILIIITSFYGGYSSVKFFQSEQAVYEGNYYNAAKIFPYNPTSHFFSGNPESGLEILGEKTVEYYRAKIFFSTLIEWKKEACIEFTEMFVYTESYFYCGNQFWNKGEHATAQKFYTQGLELLPDLWNQDSEYYDRFLIKYFNITGHRFLSDRYGLGIILNRLGMDYDK